MGNFFDALGAKIISLFMAVSLIGTPATSPAPKITPTPTQKPTIPPITWSTTITPKNEPAPVVTPKTREATDVRKVSPQPAPKKTEATASSVSTPISIPTPTASPAPQEPAPTPINQAELNQKTRAAVVNILCTTKNGNAFEPISGTGIIIDERGIILTNAHIAEYLFLATGTEHNFLDCIVRTGSPAEPAYTAELLYFSKTWMKENAQKIRESRPEGTGENDYALLRITGSVRSNTSLPSRFPATTIDSSFIPQNADHPALVVSYPGELLGGILIQTALNQVSTIAPIRQGFYFKDDDDGLLDLFSLGGTIVAQGGSSGGAVVDATSGKLVGVLATATAGRNTAEKDLKAISIGHISRSLKRETGTTLTEFLSKPIDQTSLEFKSDSFEPLKKSLVEALSNKKTP